MRSVLDEVFGAENFVGEISFAKTSGQTDNLLASVSDFILWYAKSRNEVKYRQLYKEKEIGGAGAGEYNRLLLTDGSTRSVTSEELLGDTPFPAGARLFRFAILESQSPGTKYPVVLGGRTFNPEGYWKTQRDSMPRLIAAGRVHPRANTLAYVRFFDDFPAFELNATWTDTAIAGRPGDKVYVVQTTPRAIERCLLMTTDPGDLVLDPTCGSGTTAYVAEQWGRRWITIDTSRVAMALARTRLMTARFPYYLLADSPEGVTKEMELTKERLPRRSVTSFRSCAQVWSSRTEQADY